MNKKPEFRVDAVNILSRKVLLVANDLSMPMNPDLRPGVQATITLPGIEDGRYDGNLRYTPAQAEWCKKYLQITKIEPAMADFEAGKETFVAAAWRSMQMFASWCDVTLNTVNRELLAEAHATNAAS